MANGLSENGLCGFVELSKLECDVSMMFQLGSSFYNAIGNPFSTNLPVKFVEYLDFPNLHASNEV